jgi:hypothetical protein
LPDASSRLLTDSVPVEEAIRRDLQRRSDRFEKAWSWGWLALLVVAPLAGGGAHPAMRIGLCGLVLLFWITLLSWRLIRRERTAVPLASAACAAAGAWTLLQAHTNLPGLSPLHASVGEVWPGLETVALAPVYASSGALQWIALAAALHCGTMLFATPGRISRLFLAIVGAGGITAAVGLVHSALRLDHLYGLSARGWQLPRSISAPFVNANQAGSLFGLAAICGLVLWGTSGRRSASGIGMAAAILFPLAAARMGSGSTLYGLALAYPISIFCWMVYKSLGVRTATRGMWVVASAGLLVTLALSYTSWVGQLANRLGSLASGKAALWRHGLSLVGDSPWWGYGYGGTADLMAGAPFAREVHLAMIESIPLQQVLDLGIPLAALMGLSIAVPMVRWSITETSRSHRRTRLILLLPLLFIVLDAIVGVGLAAMALSLPAATITGAALGFRQRSVAGDAPNRPWASIAVALAVAGVTVAAAPGVLPAVHRALNPFPDELTSSSTAPTPEATREFALELPASMSLWFIEASAALLRGDAERAGLVREAMTARAPDALLTRRLNLQHYISTGSHELACELLHEMMLHRRLAVNIAELGNDLVQWQTCIPDDEPTQVWWFDQLRRSNNHAHVLAAALTAMRTSAVPWVGTKAAVRASAALGFTEEARSFALRYANLAPPSISAAREAVALSELVRDPGAGERLLERTQALLGPLPALDILDFTLRVDAWWHNGRDAEAGEALDVELEALRISLITNASTAPDYLCLRAQLAIGLGRLSSARSWLDRVLDMDPRNVRAARLRASLGARE